ncbi:MAG: F0F1 ATP synthase subunit B [Ignavibacteria bacterium]
MLAVINFALVLLQEAGEHKGGLLDVNPGLIFWTAITFICLLLILKKVAWKPILHALDERETFIRESIEKAEKARTEAEKLLAENQASLAKTEEKAQKIITQGRVFAEKLKEQILSASKAESKKMIDDATSEIKRKNAEAFESLKSEVAMIVVQATEKILRENLDKEKQINIVNKFIDELPKN